jgi:hypothetical protein
MDAMALASELFGLPAAPGPIQALAQDHRKMADALDQHIQALHDTHTLALAGNTSPAMTQAGIDKDARAQDLTATAAAVRDHADGLDLIAYIFAVVISVILIWTAFLIVSSFLNPVAAAAEAGTARTAIAGARKEAANLIQKLSRKLENAFDKKGVERGGEQMNMGKWGKSKGDDGEYQDNLTGTRGNVPEEAQQKADRQASHGTSSTQSRDPEAPENWHNDN